MYWNRAPLAILAMLACADTTTNAQDRLFPPDAVVDVTKSPYFVIPNDNKDDTKSIQRAITENIGTGRSLYFPAGVYDLNDTLVCKNARGEWECAITFQGQSREKSIFRLADRAKGFTDKESPKAMLMTGSHWQTGDKLDGGGNKAFRNHIHDLQFDAGSGNAGAIAIEFAGSNCASIERVLITSKDKSGVAGIAAKRSIPGPALLNEIEVRGFDVGLDLGDIQYGFTLTQASFDSQAITAIRTSENLLHTERVTADLGDKPSLVVSKSGGVVSMVDGILAEAQAGKVQSAGTVVDSPAKLITPEPTPIYWNPNLTDWIAVGGRKPGEKDDTLAIQRAIDSGKSVVYFPNHRQYFISDTIFVRRNVRQILGMGSEISLGAAKEQFSNINNPRALFCINPVSGPDVTFENIFFNAQYPGELIFLNDSPKTLIIRHCLGWVGADGHRRTYRNSLKATGKLFVDNVFLHGWEFYNQKVFARQFNPENYDGDGSAAQVLNDGGQLWILGFKTEGPAPFIRTSNGGKTEVIGGYHYLNATKTLPTKSIPYIVEDSDLHLTICTENFTDKDYDIYIQQKRKGEVIKEWKRNDLTPRNGADSDRSRVAKAIEVLK